MTKNELRAKALEVLKGVGNPARGSWEEWTGRAYHVRIRLDKDEEAIVGPAVDCRGTAEWKKRYEAAKRFLPDAAVDLAIQEMEP